MTLAQLLFIGVLFGACGANVAAGITKNWRYLLATATCLIICVALLATVLAGQAIAR